ncbi:oogenesis-related [Syngnathoides biaculeatus]|uniref:oogenesis-related n=1 Tax=Syngnathoides biaculeatus TaxID=300417 RepID=UPI002ADDF714|nr:oogenesis-related [Syngnathoides biaculeatus]
MSAHDEPRGDPGEQPESTEVAVVEPRPSGLFGYLLRGLFWPFGIMVRAYHGFWWVLGFRTPKRATQGAPAVSSPARQRNTSRKRRRRHPLACLLLDMLPRRVQAALGYRLSTSIGCSLSPEMRVSPTKPCGKGSKRKQEDLDDEEDDYEERQTWVEALTQDLEDPDCSEEDPDYEPCSVETESEEYCSHNDTESEMEVHDVGVSIPKDVEAGLQTS